MGGHRGAPSQDASRRRWAAMIAFDNFKRGGVVQSMALDRFATSTEVSDREFGALRARECIGGDRRHSQETRYR